MPHEVKPLLFSTLEQETTWKQGFAAQVLTTGMNNEFTLRFAEYPGAAKDVKFPEDMKYCLITLREIPFVARVRIKVDPIEINPESTEIPVSFRISSCFPRGYYRMQVVLTDKNLEPMKLYSDGYAIVDKAVHPKPDAHVELATIRAELADIREEDNKLLDSLEVGAGDIASAVHRCLEQWNSRSPRTSVYTGSNFPYPDILRSGVLSTVYRSIVAFLTRNKMQYQSGGTSVDLDARVQAYMQFANTWEQKWIGGMAQAKNEEDMFGFTGALTYL